MQPTWKTVLIFLKKKIKMGLQYYPAILLLGIYLKKNENTDRKTHMHPKFIAPLLTIAKIWKKLKCLST